MEGYCLKDKRKVEMKDPQAITMKNGKPATVGTCPNCGTKIYKIGKAVAEMEGYCLKDKRKVEMKDPQPITMKNGKPATVGTCPICGTKIYRIGKSSYSSFDRD